MTNLMRDVSMEDKKYIGGFFPPSSPTSFDCLRTGFFDEKGDVDTSKIVLKTLEAGYFDVGSFAAFSRTLLTALALLATSLPGSPPRSLSTTARTSTTARSRRSGVRNGRRTWGTPQGCGRCRRRLWGRSSFDSFDV